LRIRVISINLEHKKVSDFYLSLITIDSEHLGIPDTQYSSIITMSSNEFTRICRELYALSETVIIETNKHFVRFVVSGEVVGGSIKIEAGDDTTNETIINVRNI
jgi:proliferating cell nuclear antigen